jgi:hypothetical protein
MKVIRKGGRLRSLPIEKLAERHEAIRETEVTVPLSGGRVPSSHAQRLSKLPGKGVPNTEKTLPPPLCRG